MSWGRVPCGKHATLVCWGLARGEGEIRVRLLPDRVGFLACRREAVVVLGEKRDEDGYSGFSSLAASIPTWPQQMVRNPWKPATRRSNKSVNFASCHKSTGRELLCTKVPHNGKNMRFTSCCKVTG